MNGRELTRTLREYPNLPIALVTGYNSADDRAGSEFTVLRKTL